MTSDDLMAVYNALPPDLKHEITEKAVWFLKRYAARVDEMEVDASPLKIRDGVMFVMRAIFDDWRVK